MDDGKPNNLARRSSEPNEIERSQKQTSERTALITRYLLTLSELTRQQMPSGAVAEVWYRSLSCYHPNAISAAFEDYAANGSDENDRFWFPAPAQIAARCRRMCERQSEKSELAQIDEWKRAHLSMSPEEQAAYDAEVAEFRESVRQLPKRKTL